MRKKGLVACAHCRDPTPVGNERKRASTRTHGMGRVLLSLLRGASGHVSAVLHVVRDDGGESVQDVLHGVLGAAAANFVAAGSSGATSEPPGALFYLVKYFTKDSCKINSALSVLREARQTLETHGSRAEDQGPSQGPEAGAHPDRPVRARVARAAW